MKLKKIMETKQNPPPMSQEEMIRQIWENTKKTKKYLQWQLYITLILVVLPLLAMAFLLPSVLANLGQTYSGLLK